MTFQASMTFFLYAYVMSFFISMAGMEVASWMAVVIALGGMFATRFHERQGFASLGWRPFRVGADLGFLALVAVVVVGWALNRADGADLWQILGGIRWIATFYALTWILRWRGVDPRILAPYGLSLFVSGLYGFVTFFTAWEFFRHRALEPIAASGVARAVSFLGFPMTWGHTMAMATCFGVGVLALRPFDWTSKRSRWLGIGFGLATAFAALNVGMSFTRGAWIGAAAGLVVSAIALGRRSLTGFVVALSLAVGAVCVVSPNVRERAASIFSAEPSSNQQRIQLWQANWLMFEEHPLFGVGLNENERLAPEYHAKLGHAGAFAGHAHNNFLQFLSSTGALGFLAFTGLFVYFFVWSWRLLRRIPEANRWHRGLVLGSLGAQVALHVGGLTECNFKAMTVNHHFVFQLALIAALREIYAPVSAAEKPGETP